MYMHRGTQLPVQTPKRYNAPVIIAVIIIQSIGNQ
jgi:hypothetical protein